MREKKLSDAEKTIMEILWSKKKFCSVSEIFSELENKDWKYTTVATFVSRLVKKGFLTQKKEGVQNFFKPKIKKNEYLEKETKDFVQELYGGKSTDLVACLCKDRITKEDYDELLKLLKKYE